MVQCVSARTRATGAAAWRKSFSATFPICHLRAAPWPCVVMTNRSPGPSVAMTSVAAGPERTSVEVNTSDV